MLKESLLRKESRIWEYKDQILTCFIQPATSENLKESNRLPLGEGRLLSCRTYFYKSHLLIYIYSDAFKYPLPRDAEALFILPNNSDILRFENHELIIRISIKRTTVLL